MNHTAAQRGLSIVEICREICLCLRTDRSGTREDLASLARCNRAFSDPALDALWEQANLLHLLDLIPAIKSLHSRQIVFKVIHPVQDEAWVRFDFYAPRVHTLDHHCYGYHKSLGEVGKLLQARDRPSFPMLRSIRWGVGHNYPSYRCALSEVSHFMSSSVRSLTISYSAFPIPDEGEADEESLTLLESLGSAYPNLREIKLDEYISRKTLVGFMHSFHNVQSLDLRRLRMDTNSETLHILSTLERLESLSLSEIYSIVLASATQPPGFQLLRHLSIEMADSEGVLYLLRLVSSSSLRSCILKDVVASSWRDALTFFRELSRYKMSLTELRVGLNTSGGTLVEFDSDGEMMTELLGFHHLEILALEVGYREFVDGIIPVVDCHEARRIARVWPRLRVMDMADSLFAFSLSSFVEFVSNCPNLEEVTVRNVTIGDLSGLELGYRAYRVTHLEFDVAEDEEYNPMRIADILGDLFPNLIEYDISYDIEQMMGAIAEEDEGENGV
ncbi:hypothetical protein JAAARDRAFT_210776 [Jaapia argillacea MUCL 33604]|uniref:F-box domain-containing protein n=1 Tax=Jaapia argillacea MUCL 33604 TaxID=933084 RepID=A0A067PDW3_9AGAM|nr:hypothetical protein JAAARDRAFT_210776 [Jaapia argillacea MUCL 33604]